jgi:hypothetical protein
MAEIIRYECVGPAVHGGLEHEITHGDHNCPTQLTSPGTKYRLLLLDHDATGSATGSRSTCAGATVEKVSTARGGGSRREAAVAAGRSVARRS